MTEFKAPSRRPLIGAILLGCFVIGAAIIFGAIWATRDKSEKDCPTPSITNASYKSAHGTYNYAGIAADSAVCSDIANDIMARQRGNAVDAAVAALFCTGVVNPQSAGIGGGSFFVIYDKKSGWHAVNSRETAPAAATENMYYKEEDRPKSLLGGLAVGVPGEVKGLHEVHKRFGSIPWKSVVTPSVKLLRDGFQLTEVVHKIINSRIVKLDDKTGFEDLLDANQTAAKPAGSIVKMPRLATTFQTIADDPESFYNGSLAQDIVADLGERDGIITTDDLKNYKLAWKKPTELPLPGNMTLYSMPPPGSGVVISLILSILSGYNMNADSIATDTAKIETFHRIVEAMKFAYAKRSALGDEDFVDVKDLVKNMTSRSYGEATRLRINDMMTQALAYYEPAFSLPEDSGTSHLSVVDGEGNAVSVTSTINTYFGSKVAGKRTGIIFNNEMDDFSTPNVTNFFGFAPSPSNFIRPGKRPQSSMSPSIVWDKSNGKVRMVAGAAGGSRITTTTAMLILDVLWFQSSMVEAMDRPRFHHQLLPDDIYIEKDAFSAVVKEGLAKKGHKFRNRSVMSVAHALEVLEESLIAVSDFRKGGEPRGY